MTVKKSGEEYLFELAGYLVTCATMALSGEREGSPRYSANRFLIALRKLVEIPDYVAGLADDPFLRGIVEKLESIRMEIEELQTIQMEFATEASKRLTN